MTVGHSREKKSKVNEDHTPRVNPTGLPSHSPGLVRARLAIRLRAASARQVRLRLTLVGQRIHLTLAQGRVVQARRTPTLPISILSIALGDVPSGRDHVNF
jgi:hypothetical protein